MLGPGAELTVRVEKPAAGGRMIARHEGQVLLVSAAIPGEVVRVRVEGTGRGVVRARTVEVIEGGADRRAGARDWACGGNVYAHVQYERQRRLKAEVLEDALRRIARLEPPGEIQVTGSPERGYRMRARLHVAGGRIGFHREGTHELCDPGPTGQLLSDTVDVLVELARSLRVRRVEGVSAVELAENVAGSERVIHLDAGSPLGPRDLSALKPARATGLTSHAPGTSFQAVGESSVSDTLHVEPAGGEVVPVTLRRDVRAFFQGNRYLLSRLVSRVTELTERGDVIDLYAGVGLFGVSLARAGRGPVTAIEGNRVSAGNLRENAASLGDLLKTVHSPVEEYLRTAAGARPATAVVDPPRTGMTRDALAGVVALGARRIVYVSCDVATLARDLRTLVDAGYRLTHLEGFDLFPNTAHVEAVAALDVSIDSSS